MSSVASENGEVPSYQQLGDMLLYISRTLLHYRESILAMDRLQRQTQDAQQASRSQIIEESVQEITLSSLFTDDAQNEQGVVPCQSPGGDSNSSVHPEKEDAVNNVPNLSELLKLLNPISPEAINEAFSTPAKASDSQSQPLISPSNQDEEDASDCDVAKKYACSKCPKRFAHAYMLRKHRIVHSGTQDYPCDLCGRPFNRKDNLRRHMKNHPPPSNQLNKVETPANSVVSPDLDNMLSMVLTDALFTPTPRPKSSICPPAPANSPFL